MKKTKTNAAINAKLDAILADLQAAVKSSQAIAQIGGGCA